VEVSVTVVVPTNGRPTLQRLLDALGAADGPLPEQLLLVDDRRDRSVSLALRTPARLDARLRVLPGQGRGPAGQVK